MNYNLKVEMERSRDKYVTNLEVSGVGRAGRQRIVSATFEQALADLKTAHDEELAKIEAYHKPPAPVLSDEEKAAAAKAEKAAARKAARAAKPKKPKARKAAAAKAE